MRGHVISAEARWTSRLAANMAPGGGVPSPTYLLNIGPEGIHEEGKLEGVQEGECAHHVDILPVALETRCRPEFCMDM